MSNEGLGNFAKQHPLKIVCGLLALFSGVGVYLVSGKIEETSTLLQQKTTEGLRLAVNVRNSAQLSEQLDALVAAGAKIDDRLVRATQLASNLQYFYRLEADSGLELIDLRQTSSSQPVKANTGVAFAVTLKGEYSTLLGFLRRLENGTHLSRIVTASISGSPIERAAPLTLSMSLELLGQP